MIKRVFTILLLLLSLQLHARKIGYEEAKRGAEHFFRLLEDGDSLKSGVVIKVDTFCTWPASRGNLLKTAGLTRDPAFYIFNRLDRDGFVIVSAESDVKEIIAWSADSKICDIPPPMEALLDQYSAEISYTGSRESLPDKTLKNSVLATPLLGDIRWNQAPDPFNTLCPYDEPTDRVCPSGCVATAMAQVIYYWKSPRVGTGSFGYSTPYGYLSANFGQSEYKFEEMIDSPWPGVANGEIAKLIYHCAVAVEMDFGPYSSSAYSGLIPQVLEKYFKYKKSTFAFRTPYTSDAWKNLIKKEIDAGRPVIYSGQDPPEPDNPNDVSGGHAFVVDGYDSGDLFHINWGWGGCSDGYYSLDLLNPSDCGDQYYYTVSHSLVFGLEPLSTAECLFSVNANQLKFPVSGGKDTVEVRSNSDWTVTSEDWWLTIYPPSENGNKSFEVTARENTGALGRTGKVTIKGCGVTHTITVVQDGSCTIEPARDFLEFSVAAQSKSFFLMSTASWTITSDSQWITLLSDSGTGDETITVFVESNEGGVERSGYLLINGCGVTKLVRVFQDGSCFLILGAHSLNMGSEPESADTEIFSNGEWSVETDVSWISLNPVSGRGNGVLTIGVAENSEEVKRSGTITVRGCNIWRSIQVTQQGPCTLEASPMSVDFSSSPSDRYITIFSGSSWKATTAEPWITISPAAGNGSTTMKISVSENKIPETRTGIIFVSGCNMVKQVTVTQRSSCILEFSSPLVDFTYMPGNKTITVNSSSQWTAVSAQSWITISPKSGNRNSSVKVEVDMNQGDSPRTGTIIFSGCNTSRGVKVEQSECSFILSEKELEFPIEGGGKTLGISSNTSWSLSSSSPWISLSSFIGNKNGTVNVFVSGNSSDPRSGWVKVSGCFSSMNVNVTQEGLSTPAPEIATLKGRIFPSPANGFVRLEPEEECRNPLLEIYSVTGEKVRMILYPGKIIPLDGIPPGLYLFRLSCGDNSFTEKIVIR